MTTHTGTIIDATFVDAPRQRNSRKENEKIKNGDVPKDWEKPENAAKLAQKDKDARWVKENGEAHSGYKGHVKRDADSKLITGYGASATSIHASQMCTELLDDDEVFYADSAYSSAVITENPPENCKNEICEK